MGKRTGNPRGAPPKPDEEKVVVRQYSLPRRLVERFEEQVPRGGRSEYVQRAIEEKLGPEHEKEGAG